MSDLLHPDVFREVLEELQVGVYFTDLQRRIVFWNSGAERISGYLRQEVLGRNCRDNILVHCDHKQSVVCGRACPLSEAIAEGKPREASLFLQHKSGHRVPIRIHSMPIRDAKGGVIGAAECFQRQRYLPHPERRETTGFYAMEAVPEYGVIASEIRLRLGRLREGGAGFGVLCLAADHFAEVRTTRGYEACETILHVMAHTLQNTIRPGDMVGAWPEGRLMVVLASVSGEALAQTGERLRALISCSNVVWWGDCIPLTVSCGGTPARTEDTVESVIERAERGLDVSRSQGGDRITVLRE